MADLLSQAILNSARGYAGYITKLAKGFSESSRIRATIRSSVEAKGNSIKITTTAGDGTDNTGDAAAREFGSGLHGPKHAKYPILPKKGKALVFFWEKAYDYIPKTEDGRVILPGVMHPGIQADNNGKGYIRPAAEIAEEALLESLKKKGASAIRAELRSAFRVTNVR